jgi:hypothetical protein
MTAAVENIIPMAIVLEAATAAASGSRSCDDTARSADTVWGVHSISYCSI